MDFSEGLAAVETTVWAERSGVYANPAVKLSEKAHRHLLVARRGYIDTKGEMVVPPLFDSVGPYQNGLAPVRIHVRSKAPEQNRMFEGLIDKTGQLVFVKSNPAL